MAKTHEIRNQIKYCL